MLRQCSSILAKSLPSILDWDIFSFLTPKNSKLQELEPIKDCTIQHSLNLGKLGSSFNYNSVFTSGHIIYGEQWVMESSLQEGLSPHLQKSRDEEGKAGIHAVGMLIVKEKAGEMQG